MNELLASIKDLKWDVVVGQVVVLTAAFIGGAVSPWITNRFERRKRKWSLIAAITETVRLYYSERARYYTQVNETHLYIHKYNSVVTKLSNSPQDGRLLKEYDTLEKMVVTCKEYEIEINKRNGQLTSQLSGLTIQVLELFGKRRYTNLNNFFEDNMKPIDKPPIFVDKYSNDVHIFNEQFKEAKAEHELAIKLNSELRRTIEKGIVDILC